MGLNISESSLNFEKVLEKDYIDKSNLEKFEECNVLIIPNRISESTDEFSIPEFTLEFVDYINDNNKIIKCDVPMDDKKLRIHEKHSFEMDIPTMIITSIVLPEIVNIIHDFLRDFIKKHHRKENETNVRFSLFVDNKNRCKEIKYEGKVSDVKEALDYAMKNMFDN